MKQIMTNFLDDFFLGRDFHFHFRWKLFIPLLYQFNSRWRISFVGELAAICFNLKIPSTLLHLNWIKLAVGRIHWGKFPRRDFISTVSWMRKFMCNRWKFTSINLNNPSPEWCFNYLANYSSETVPKPLHALQEDTRPSNAVSKAQLFTTHENLSQ